ncbi:NifU family protein [Actinacidiphila acididurans]|uniref:NifU family protein n=1 Tax=Actinacidiphila acididurans TaxID=2784346 RepID=A0ABS2U3R7_9ACTN|nr:NifU family protein [Actinacidiphila acididurans]MBM9510250.1 NifU family protein [Actinacidiphila acididurans]
MSAPATAREDRETRDDEVTRRRVIEAEELLSALDTLPDNRAAARAGAAVEALVGLYGECLARITGHLSAHGGEQALRALADDQLVGHLLLVHDLHPDPVATRVRAALAALPDPPELLELTDTAVRLAVRPGCGAQAAEQTVRDALAARAPEIEDVQVTTAAPEALIPVSALFRDSGGASAGPPGSAPGPARPPGQEAACTP